MKKISSVVWKFFERIVESGRCVAVVCKLCDNQYKYFGNTTNLRVHLINKHPVQWELSENGTLDETNCPSGALNASTPTKRRNLKVRANSSKNVRYSVSVNKEGSGGEIPKIAIERVETNSDSNDDDVSTINLVRQMHGDQNSEEEWLEEDPYQVTHMETYSHEPKRKRKYKKIKREVASPTDLSNFYLPKQEKIIYEEATQKDEYSVFGEYVANKLRKVKTSRTRGNLQQLITTILWQAEYGLYDNADTVKRVLLMNLQGTETEYEIQAQTDDPQNEVTIGSVIGNVSPGQQSHGSASVLT